VLMAYEEVLAMFEIEYLPNDHTAEKFLLWIVRRLRIVSPFPARLVTE